MTKNASGKPARSHAPEPRDRGVQLGYSTNVHRSESLEQIYRFLHDYTLPVRRKVYRKARSGLELRLGVGAARDLTSRGRREELRTFLDESGLDLFSINAFPLHDFQARRVKESVYSPSWEKRDRVTWTRRICRIFADLLPTDRPGSVSTLAGTYRFWSHSPATLARMADNYLAILEDLEEIEARDGKRIVLAVEPEPDTTMECSKDVIRFVEDWLLPGASVRWKRRHGNRARIEAAVRQRFTVNVDTCHFSVVFEHPVDALRHLSGAGIAVGKLHVTNALALRHPRRSPRGYATLRGMHEPRFLHQCRGLGADGEVAWRGRDLDSLPRWPISDRQPDLAEIRTHFHVPLYLKRWKSLRTTQGETRAAVRHTLEHRLCRHLVLETYTWPVLATADHLLGGIVREFRWLRQTVEEN